jgi:signal transduction histidine kinase
MYRRLIILSIVVLAAVCGLSGLGYHAIEKWAQGLEGARLGEFAEVAEQVRQDVKRKLDDFIRAEQQRKYTDYLYYYVPDNVAGAQQQLPVLRSPLANSWSNDFANGYFQIESDGRIVMPYYAGATPRPGDSSVPAEIVRRHLANIDYNVLPLITRRSGALRASEQQTSLLDLNDIPEFASTKTNMDSQTSAGQPIQKGKGANYQIESLQKEAQTPQVITQQRQFITSNSAVQADLSATQQQAMQEAATQMAPPPYPARDARSVPVPQGQARVQQQENQSDMVQIRIEPFVPLVVPDPNHAASIFGGQVFLLRHVQIEDRHLLQGFQLDEPRLVAEVKESAGRFMRDGMAFELPQVHRINGGTEETDVKPAYMAILDFGFGELILNLKETDPEWIAERIGNIHNIYLAIIATVLAAVGLALTSLWHNVRAQVRLARKKDDFISAVSHELRTPLTSIRMYSEMLEKNWVKTPDKLAEYYRNMRQESERLSRLVENVLDFARLQKGRKRYAFQLGNLNDCIAEVVAMMRPYAEQRGFTIQAHLEETGQTPFDKDAVTQIVVNLIDNAVKYAAGASDRTITVRTRQANGFILIEVGDHGPGIPHRRRKKVFQEFYRCDDVPVGADPRVCPPAQDQPQAAPTTGTGLGLTLVKRFAEAHGGYVEIDSARPTGALLRVALAVHLPAAS